MIRFYLYVILLIFFFQCFNRKCKNCSVDAVKKYKTGDDKEFSFLDPVKVVLPECLELMFQHLMCHQILNLSLVSPSWAKSVDESYVALKRITFVLRPENFNNLQKSSRKYQNVRVFHDDILIQRADFLSPLLMALKSKRSLSFSGRFGKACIEDFFDKLTENIGDFCVDHLTFYGTVSNAAMLLKRFAAIKEYSTITLIAFGKGTFRNDVINQLRAGKVILKSLSLCKLNRTELVQNSSIKELHFSKVTIDKESAEHLVKLFINLKMISVDNWDLMRSDVQQLLRERCIAGFECRIMPNLPVDYFMVLSAPNVQNLISQHFSCEDLISVSTVSKSWFNMSKVKISKTVEYNLFSSFVTKRTYENVNTVVDEDIISVIKTFPFTFTLKELSVELMPKSITNLVYLFKFQHFRNLTLLNVTCHESSPLDDLKLPTTLETLHLTNFQLTSDDAVSTTFYESLAQAKALVNLQFFETVGLDKLFSTDIAKTLEFKLRALRLLVDETNSEMVENFRSFLKSQLKTLETLSVNKVHVDTIRVIAENSCITSLEILSFAGSLESLNVAKDIETLTDLLVPTIKSFEDLKFLLKLAPKLRKIHLFRLSETSLEYLRKNFNHLQEIRFTKGQKPKCPAKKTRLTLRRSSFHAEQFTA